MSKITFFRTYDFFLSLLKWKIYIDGKMMGKIGNGGMTSFTLLPGEYEIIINCPDFPIISRKKGMYSNSIKLKVEECIDYSFSIQPHPLSWWGKHFPDWTQPWKAVECLLLLKQDEHFKDNIKYLEQFGNQIQDEIKTFTYHPISVILVVAISLFSIISSIFLPDLYATGDGIAWGFFFGITNLFGLFLGGKDRPMMARGWEHKFLSYTAFGAMMILVFIPWAYPWQSTLYLFFVLTACFWAYFSFKGWKKDKERLDNMEQMKIKFEKGF